MSDLICILLTVLQLLERKVAAPFLSMTRNIIRIDFAYSARGSAMDRIVCLEETISVAGRVAARLIHANLAVSWPRSLYQFHKLTDQGVRKFFSSGIFCVFEGLPRGITTPARKFLPLFLATLIDKEVVDFKVSPLHVVAKPAPLTLKQDVGATTLELFLGAIAKPFQYLAYENRFAEALKRHDDPYLIDAFIDVGKNPDYNSNRDLFSCE